MHTHTKGGAETTCSLAEKEASVQQKAIWKMAKTKHGPKPLLCSSLARAHSYNFTGNSLKLVHPPWKQANVTNGFTMPLQLIAAQEKPVVGLTATR